MQEPQSFSATPRQTPASQQETFALHAGKSISRGQLWADVRALAEHLPDRPYVFNLCDNRYLFCLLLLAAASRGQTCLLPPSGKTAIIEEIAADYPGAYLAGDNSPEPGALEWFEVMAPACHNGAEAIALDWNRSRLIAFTSGSTGKPRPCRHTLMTFKISAAMAVKALGLEGQRRLMLSTAPPQHMYGLETSVFWPLFSSLILHDGRPFFPADILSLIATAPWPTVLATTPTHLRSLTQIDGPWPNLAAVLSATDALSDKLAETTLATLGQSPYEIYGSTETLSFASRQPLRDGLWRPYPGSRLIAADSGQIRLESPHLPAASALQDSFEIAADGRFTVRGRQADLVKIGGKRASLAELNRRLKDIDGVEDGFCFVPNDGPGAGRLVAVVAGNPDRQRIRAGLQPYVDAVFLPRKIHFVASIPRNATGKLVKAEMERLLAELI